MRALYFLASLALLPLPAAAKDKEMPLVDLFARAVMGIADGAGTRAGDVANFVREAPGVYRISTEAGEPRGRVAFTEARPCVFIAVYSNGSGLSLQMMRFDASVLADINYELRNQSDELNDVQVTFQPSLIEFLEPDGAVWGQRGDFRGETSLTIEEMEAAGAVLLEACSGSASPTEPDEKTQSVSQYADGLQPVDLHA